MAEINQFSGGQVEKRHTDEFAKCIVGQIHVT